jgi:hypothetical protein
MGISPLASFFFTPLPLLDFQPAGHFIFISRSPYFQIYQSLQVIMRSFSILTALLFAFVATSYATDMTILDARKVHNETRSRGGDTTQKACKEMRKLTVLTSLAANQTKLDTLVAEGKIDTAKADKLKKEAAAAAPKLQALTANSTLVDECATIDAEGHMTQQCKQMKRLQRLAKLAGNATAMDAFAAKQNLNATQVDGLENKVQEAETKLKALEANATLTDFCKQMKQGQQSGGADGKLKSGLSVEDLLMNS